MKCFTNAALTMFAGLIAVGGAALPAQAGQSTLADSQPTRSAHAAATGGGVPAPANQGTQYLLNNSDYVRGWGDDGVKGQVKNFTNKTIVVHDRLCGKVREIAPGQRVVFYADADLSGYAKCDAGDGARLEISEKGSQMKVSQFWLSDSWVGRPDAVFDGPHGVQNVRKTMSVNEAHHEHAGSHKFWIKRESDSWKEKYDNWNTADWVAFSIHVDSI